MLTIDVLTHYIWGVALIGMSALYLAIALKKISYIRLNYSTGIILALVGLTYNHLLLGNFNFSPNQFKVLSTANAQHFLIDIIAIGAAISLCLFANNKKVTQFIKISGFLLIGGVFLVHDQSHIHNHADWLIPYHIWLGILLIVIALFECFILFKRNHIQIIYMIGSLLLYFAGTSLLLYKNPTSNTLATNCQSIGKTFEVTLSDRGFNPESLNADRCDQLYVKNVGKITAKIAFGNHENHSTYADHTEKKLDQNDAQIILLSQSGKYSLHNHFNDDMKLELTIN